MEEETANRPKWLLELENRKRKPRLAHEAGAGASCMNCNSACPGLDLHFWRKICKNCKCSRDDHDVDDDEFPQFDLLFGPSGKFKKKTMRLKVNNKKQNEAETTFEWIPPDTTEELAMDYMKALPVEKLPIKGSVGAVLRKQLLQKQLPLHDIDHKVCDELSEQEQKQFEKYLENIKKYVGQGKVMKMLGARPFERSLMTPINATDMQHFSPQHKAYIPSTGVQLRTPSSFAVKNLYAKHPHENKQDSMIINDNKISKAEEYNCSLTNVPANNNIAKSQLIGGKLINENLQYEGDIVSINEKAMENKVIHSSIPAHLAEQEIVPVREMHTSGNYIPYGRNALKDALERHRETLNNILPYTADLKTVNNEAASMAESILADALLPPSAIHANDIIGSTLDEKSLMFIREKLADKYNAMENLVTHTVPKSSQLLDTNDVLRSTGSKENNNNPMNINKDAERTAIETAMKNSAGTLLENTKVNNIINTPVEAERKKYKSPSQIIESIALPIRANHKPTKNNSSMIESKTIAENAMDPLLNKYISVDPTLPTLNSSLQSDSQGLVNDSPLQAELSSSILQSTVIHSEQLQKQVFPHIIGDCNEQSNAQHVDYLKDNMKDLKIESTKVHKCEKCHEDIRVDDVIVTAEKANNAFWHPGCFVCSVCNELLVDLVYFYYKNKLYCGRDLAAFLGIVRCFACDELIFVREYTVAEGHNYHVKHFCCWDCDMPLAGQQYITENDRPLCLPCYQKSYAKTCAACNIVIAADQQGVTIKNLNFHATEVCFCCFSCKKNLLNGRMAIKEDKLFCSKDCITKFLNR
ncbi:transforming growth factor beta-1-induced transcript 1 protein [Nylanderia fulva]|uniref:transforming growth factor beta-1-induced transcript 1 protein n=1 Tax=Nylanderia fulva TaxID=613905 RepID=UPI0010FB29D2|nr:transforming growth factor beta-1-induced transcript 1 protein [Nylanderia fulva]